MYSHSTQAYPIYSLLIAFPLRSSAETQIESSFSRLLGYDKEVCNLLGSLGCREHLVSMLWGCLLPESLG